MKGTRKTDAETITFEQLHLLHADRTNRLQWDCPFVLPFWLESWFARFGRENTRNLVALYEDGKILGIAPLMVRDGEARFIGSESVCDFQDMIIVENEEEKFYPALFDYLENEGVTSLTLGALKTKSKSLIYIQKIALSRGLPVTRKTAGNLYVITLPDNWDGYLSSLAGKQRHEIRRKIRRLDDFGSYEFLVVSGEVAARNNFEEFLKMFAESSEDKNTFLDEYNKSFFISLAEGLADNNMLQLGVLKIDGTSAGMVFCFTLGKETFLYNNGYKKKFSATSAGILSKVLSIKFNVGKGVEKYNLLKGDEKYKKHLGGVAVPLTRLRISFEH